MSDESTTPEEKPAKARKSAAKAKAPTPSTTSEAALPAATEEKPAAEAVTTAAPTVPEISVKIKVLENGLKVAGGVAAKGRVLNLKKSQAVALQELGKVKIIGI